MRDNGDMNRRTGQNTKSGGRQSPRGIFVAKVAENRAVCLDHFMVSLDIQAFPSSAPGQFINIGPVIGRAGGPLQPARPLLKRPFSILSREELSGGAARIGLLYRVRGPGTTWLGTLRPGDVAQVIGPLGQGFRTPDGMRTALLVAGGTGIAPLIYLAAQLKGSRPHVHVVMFEGVRSKSVLPLRLDLSEPCPEPKRISSDVADIPLVIASDDGTVGLPGTVVDAAQRWIAANLETIDAATRRHGEKETTAGAVGEPRGIVGEETCVFACGPEPMMAAMAAVCERHGLRCQVSLEKSMACGMGTCQSCVVKIKDPADPDGWVYKLCCKDGPPFDAAEVIWR